VSERCFACDLLSGAEPLPGGRITETAHWVVEHCVGPLGLGTAIVKPIRHVVHVSELDEDEAAELGPLLVRVSGAVERYAGAEQVYVTLWSHMGGVPVHIHFVVQPVSAELKEAYGGIVGPRLQLAMFDGAEPLDPTGVEAASAAIRGILA
jgi:diadenosine tetraphosphate (Ap4A) HIT family hydrolase